MELAIGENAWWGTSVDRIQGIKYAKEVGFDGYAIMTMDLTPKIKRGMIEAMRETQLKCSNFTTVTTALADFVPDIRKLTIEWAKRQVDVGYEFGSEINVVVPGEYVWAQQEIKPEVQWQWLVEGVREIADYAKSLGIVIGLECETPQYSMLRSIDTLVKFIKDADHPAIKANVDLVHMHVVGDRPEALEKLRGNIVDVHFCDTKGNYHAHFPPGWGVVPLRECLSVLKRMGYDGPITVELEWSPEPDKIYDWVKQAEIATAAMMSEAGLKRS